MVSLIACKIADQYCQMTSELQQIPANGLHVGDQHNSALDGTRLNLESITSLEPLAPIYDLLDDALIDNRPVHIEYLLISRQYYKRILPIIYNHVNINNDNIGQLIYPWVQESENFGTGSVDGRRKAEALKLVEVVTLSDAEAAEKLAWWSLNHSHLLNAKQPTKIWGIPHSLSTCAFPNVKHVRLEWDFIGPKGFLNQAPYTASLATFRPPISGVSWGLIFDQVFTQQLAVTSFCSSMPLPMLGTCDLYTALTIGSFSRGITDLLGRLSKRNSVPLQTFVFHYYLCETPDYPRLPGVSLPTPPDGVSVYYDFEFQEEKMKTTVEILREIYSLFKFSMWKAWRKADLSKVTFVIPFREDLDKAVQELRYGIREYIVPRRRSVTVDDLYPRIQMRDEKINRCPCKKHVMVPKA